MASVYNDPEHSEPFDITLPVPPDGNVQVWIFQTAIDQLSITAQDQAFQSGHNLYFLVLYCFSDLQTVELFISSLVLMKKSWGSNCCNYQVFLPYMWPIIKFSKLWSSTANQHSYKTLSAAALYFSTYFFLVQGGENQVFCNIFGFMKYSFLVAKLHLDEAVYRFFYKKAHTPIIF